MKRWWQHRRLRIHLTLWYVSAMVVILALYATGVLAFVSRRRLGVARCRDPRRLCVGGGNVGPA